MLIAIGAAGARCCDERSGEYVFMVRLVFMIMGLSFPSIILPSSIDHLHAHLARGATTTTSVAFVVVVPRALPPAAASTATVAVGVTPTPTSST